MSVLKFDGNSKIGAGLFINDALDIELSHKDGTVSAWKMHALTQDRIIELQKSGVKFEDYASNEEMLEHTTAILSAIVDSGECDGVSVNSENLNRVLSNPKLAADLIGVGHQLAQGRTEEDSGNSGNSSAGSLPPTAENTGSSSSGPTVKAN